MLWPLRPDDVHLWHIDLDHLPPGAATRCEAALGPEERARRGTLARARSRARYTAAHGALRLLIGRALSLPPAEVRLRRGPLGKPDLAEGTGDLMFSLAHAGGRALAAVAAGRAVGVDLDEPRRGFPLDSFARRYFPPAEYEVVLAAAVDRRPQVFLQLWTRKEALVKAAGARMALGVRQPVGALSGPAVVRGNHPHLQGTWRIHDLPPPPGAVAAVALAGSRPYRLITHDWSSTTT